MIEPVDTVEWAERTDKLKTAGADLGASVYECVREWQSRQPKWVLDALDEADILRTVADALDNGIDNG